MITSFKLLLKNPTQVSPLHSCHLKYDLPVTVLVSGIWWWSCSYLTFRTPEFLFLMEPEWNYSFHHPSSAVVVWIYCINVKRGTLGENLGLEVGAAYKGKTWARIIFQPKSIDLTADRKIHLTGLPCCLFVRILGWWFPNHKRHDALKR